MKVRKIDYRRIEEWRDKGMTLEAIGMKLTPSVSKQAIHQILDKEERPIPQQ